MERQLTFEVFVATLYGMPKGKAVGQSGLSVDLLRAFERGGAEQRLIYDSIMEDFAAASIPASWSCVVYALLIKPATAATAIAGAAIAITTFAAAVSADTAAAILAIIATATANPDGGGGQRPPLQNSSIATAGIGQPWPTPITALVRAEVVVV